MSYDPPEGEFEPITISDRDLMAEAEIELDSRLEMGGLCELIDELTSTSNDFAEFEANLWAWLNDNRNARAFICRKYVFKNSKKLEEKLQQMHIVECASRKENRGNNDE